MEKILVIVVTYNAMQWINLCLDSIINSTFPADIFVVDNGSSDGTQQHIQKHYPHVLFHRSTCNLGFGKANNIGLLYARNNFYEYVYLLNQDAWILPDTLGTLIQTQKLHQEYGILSPFQLTANMRLLDSNFSQYVCAYNSTPHLLSDLYFQSLDEVYEVPVVMAAHWLISRECLLKVGGFSPSFVHYGEDDNYASRAIFHGFKVGIVPKACGIHDRENRPMPVSKQDYLNFYVSDVRSASNPISEYRPHFLRDFFYRCKISISQRRVDPIRFFFRFMKEYSSIIKNKVVSIKEEGAFLLSNDLL